MLNKIRKLLVVVIAASLLGNQSFAFELCSTQKDSINLASIKEIAKEQAEIAKPLGLIVREINSAFVSPGNSCISRLRSSSSKLRRTILLLEKRKGNVIEANIASLRETLKSIDSAISTDSNKDGIPDICNDDPDEDGVPSRVDNCPQVKNPLQKDTDKNRIGDACDLFICCDSPLDEINTCDKKTIKSCREENKVVMNCIVPLKKNGPSLQNNVNVSTFSSILGRNFTYKFEEKPETESDEDFLDRLEKAIDMSKVPSMEYGEDYDCDNFADDLEQELEGQGFMATFTASWTDDGSKTVPGHALTDVHTPNGGIVWVEPQTGEIVDLDEDGDGQVMAADGTHSDEFMATEGMSQIEVYEDKSSAVMAGVPVD